MCVIVVKEKYGKLPSKTDLENCFTRNGDGAGFMYVENGSVVVDKGYMNFKSFYKHYEKLCQKFNNFKGKNLVMHLRISTAGGVKPENTHPFMITDDFKDMKKTYKKCDVALVHNGIISIARPSKNQESMGINDTMVYIKEYIYPIYKSWKKCFDNNAYLLGINSMTSSKFAILDSKDNLYRIGEFQEHNGAFYSNDSYKGYSYNYGAYNWDYFDDSYFDDYYYKRYRTDRYDDMVDYDFEELEGLEDDEKLEQIDDDLNKVFINGRDLEVNDYGMLVCPEDYKVYFGEQEVGKRWKKISELRTEDNSKFYYDMEVATLYEVNKDDEVLNEYKERSLYDNNYCLLFE